MRDRVDSFNALYGGYMRYIFHPSKTATVEDIVRDVTILEVRENFIADVVIIDYADLIKPSTPDNKRLELDDIWEGLRALGQSKQVLVVTASQTNKGGVGSTIITELDIAEDFSKLAKLDLGIGIAYTSRMKVAGLSNLNKIVSRHTQYTIDRPCTVLHKLNRIQPYLDSEFQWL